MNRFAVLGGFVAGIAALVALGVFVAGRSAPPPRQQSAAAVCDVAVAKDANLSFRVKDLTGAEHSLADYKGKVLLLDFWATWCEPCKAEIPGFVALYEKYRAQGFEIVGLLSLDEAKNVPAFNETFKMNYQILDANDRPDIEQAFGGIEGLPTSILIGRDGKICREHLGFTPVEAFEREILALL